MDLYKRKFNPSVWVSIKQARAWYRNISPDLSVSLKEEIESVVTAVVRRPLGYGIRFLNVRRINLERFPYAFHYLIDEATMTIVFLNFFHVKMNRLYDEDDSENTLNEH